LQKRKEANDMKRLTGKDKNGKYYIVEEKYCMCTEKINPIRKWVVDNEIRGYGKPIDRLGELEDLADEIGCPLKVRCKVVQNTSIFAEQECGLNSNEWLVNRITSIGFECQQLNKYVYITRIHFWKDYKKTWWLKEDRSE
jgi:hypothetical protein